MQNELPQSAPANYETELQHRDNPPPGYEEHKLGSAQRGTDPFDAVAGTTGQIRTERFAADVRPIAVMPVEGIPPETQANDFITPESRPRELRPREVIPPEGR